MLKAAAKELVRVAAAAVLTVAAFAYASGGGSGGNALKSLGLNQFAATTSAQLFGVISDETGAGAAVAASGATMSNLTVQNSLSCGKGVFSSASTEALSATASGGNAQGITAGGNGSGHGVNATGGATTGACGLRGVGGGANTCGVLGIGLGAGTGLTAENTATGYAFLCNSDKTSPARPCGIFDPQDTDPVTGATGAIYVNTAGVWRTWTAAAGWHNIGSQ